jgi:acyl-CoA synthetase (NDP forming)
LAVVSNSGAVCVLAADAAEDEGLQLAELAPETVTRLKEALPAFAATSNPVDVTAALLTDSSIFGRVLPILGDDPNVDACLLGIPVAGRGYDVEQFARDAAAFAASGTPLVLAIPQPNVAAPFVRAGLAVFQDESTALAALGQYLAHRHRMARAEGLPRPACGPREPLEPGQLNEADSLAVLAELGVPVVPHEFVPTVSEVEAAVVRLAVPEVVVKGCSSQASHKSELGLVRLRRSSPADARTAAEEITAAAARHGVQLDGFLVAPMVAGLNEALIGASLDPVFGPVMVLGAGGVYVEAMPDTRVLLAPCTAEEVHEAIAQLRMAPVLTGLRGEPAADVDAWVKAVVRASEAIAEAASPIAGFDANPVMLLRHGVCAVDAVVLRR